MTPHVRHIVIATAIAVAVTGVASRSAAAGAPPLSQLGWLIGVWHAQALGGELEDVYEPLANGEILSTMRLGVQGRTTRYELLRIHEGDKIVYQELGFGPSMQPAEPVPDRVLESIDAQHAQFEHLTLRHTGADLMLVTAELPGRERGAARAVEIHYTRVLVFRPPHGPAGVSAASE
jgi:Domain of unknown function (DUF6265)